MLYVQSNGADKLIERIRRCRAKAGSAIRKRRQREHTTASSPKKRNVTDDLRDTHRPQRVRSLLGVIEIGGAEMGRGITLTRPRQAPLGDLANRSQIPPCQRSVNGATGKEAAGNIRSGERLSPCPFGM